MTAGGEWGGGSGSVPAIRAVAALEDDLRRGMYAYCRWAGHPVTRDEAAAQVGISRKLAAFHLDKLVDAGLLQAHYAQVGRIRRVGRAPKVYEPTNEPVRISIPQRHHELLAELLLDAVLQERPGESAAASALRVARDRGADVGADDTRHRPPGPARRGTRADDRRGRAGPPWVRTPPRGTGLAPPSQLPLPAARR